MPLFPRHALRVPVVAVLLLCGAARAGAAPIRSELLFSAGAAEAFSREAVLTFAAEWRSPKNLGGIYPLALGMWSTDGALYFGCAAAYDLPLDSRWTVTLSSGPGYYQRNRSPRDLGSSLEFYSNFEISRKFAKGRRLALSVGHISNGSISDRNPGSETVRISYSLPL